MQNELSVKMIMWSSVYSCLSATAMAANSALLIVCLSGCDLMSMCVMASGRVVSILCVWVLCPYFWAKVMFRVLWMCVTSSCVSAFEFATRYICRLYLGRCWCWVVCVCGIVAMC